MPKASVLIVDDKPANLLSLRELLSTCEENNALAGGLEVIEATSGREALDILMEKDVTLVLLDVQMPGMDGYEVASAMAAKEKTRKTPIIFLSAVYADEMHINLGYQEGAIDFISKPVNPLLLKNKIRNFLKIHEALLDAMEAKKEKEATLEALHLKTEFLMHMSHELRTPMNGVIGMADVLTYGPLDTEQRECVEVIQSSGKRMLELVEGILEFSKLESNSPGLESEAVDCAALFQEMKTVFQSASEKKNIQWENQVDPALPRLRGDRGKLQQVLTKLVDNAIKFSENGKVMVRALRSKEENGKVSVTFEVVDNGIGMTAEEQKNIFGVFSQVDSSMTKKYNGIGLGLVTCKRLVERMHGELTCRSEKGRGSTFTFVIPLEREF